MASTVQVLLRALGVDIDPAELMRVAQDAKGIVEEFGARLARMEAQQLRILSLLEKGNDDGQSDTGNRGLIPIVNGRGPAPPATK